MLWFASWLHSSLFLLPICRRSVHFLIQIKQPVDANFCGLFLVSIFPSSWLTQLNKQCSTMKNVGFYVIPNYWIFSFLVAGLLSHNTILRIINFVKACFQFLSFKNVQSPTRLPFRLIGEGVMTSWLKTVICIGCGNGSTHTVLFTFHPSKINQYKCMANWRPSYTWAVETVKAVHTSCPVSFVTHQKWYQYQSLVNDHHSVWLTCWNFASNCYVSFVTHGK